MVLIHKDAIRLVKSALVDFDTYVISREHSGGGLQGKIFSSEPPGIRLIESLNGLNDWSIDSVTHLKTEDSVMNQIHETFRSRYFDPKNMRKLDDEFKSFHDNLIVLRDECKKLTTLSGQVLGSRVVCYPSFLGLPQQGRVAPFKEFLTLEIPEGATSYFILVGDDYFLRLLEKLTELKSCLDSIENTSVIIAKAMKSEMVYLSETHDFLVKDISFISTWERNIRSWVDEEK